MWNRVFLAALLICAIVAGFFAWYGWSWLGSIGDPTTAWQNYAYHRSMGIYATLVSTALLIVLGSVLLWVKGKGWSLWAAEAYAVILALIFLVLLNNAAANYCVENRLCTEPSRAAGALITVFGGIALAAVIYGVHFLVLRLRERMYPATEPTPKIENSRDGDPES